MGIACLLYFAAPVCANDPAPAPPPPAPAMGVGAAAVLGIVEGLTEYLPVSSTGHLILAQRAMGIGPQAGDEDAAQLRAKTAADSFAICIQGGAILAVLGLYWRRVRSMLRGLIGRDPAGRRLFINLGVALIPAVVIGLSLESFIKDYLFNLRLIVAAWLVGGIAILAVGWWRRRRFGPDEAHEQGEHAGMSLDELTWRRALAIGLLQCIAMWPGTSRSLMTLVGGVLVGLRLPAAVEFSFLLGVATLGGATAKNAISDGPLMLDYYGPAPLLAGFLAAFVSAVLAIKWMVAYLQRRPLDAFGWYRIALAIVVGVLLWRGALGEV